MILTENVMLEALKKIKILVNNTMWYFRLTTPLLAKATRINVSQSINDNNLSTIISLYLAIKLLKYNQSTKKYNHKKDYKSILEDIDLSFDTERIVSEILEVDKETINEIVYSIISLKEEEIIHFDFLTTETVNGTDLDVDALLRNTDDIELEDIEFKDNKYQKREIIVPPVVEENISENNEEVVLDNVQTNESDELENNNKEIEEIEKQDEIIENNQIEEIVNEANDNNDSIIEDTTNDTDNNVEVENAKVIKEEGPILDSSYLIKENFIISYSKTKDEFDISGDDIVKFAKDKLDLAINSNISYEEKINILLGVYSLLKLSQKKHTLREKMVLSKIEKELSSSLKISKEYLSSIFSKFRN